MHAMTMILAVALTVWLPQQVSTKPDFSGTWKLDPAKSAVAAPPGGRAGDVSPQLLEPIVVKQTSDQLVVTQKPGDTPFTLVYRLDGSPSTLAWPAGGTETVDATAVAKWDGDKLRIATRIPINGHVYENTETWSIAGGRLTIELVTSHGKDVRVYGIVR